MKTVIVIVLVFIVNPLMSQIYKPIVYLKMDGNYADVSPASTAITASGTSFIGAKIYEGVYFPGTSYLKTSSSFSFPSDNRIWITFWCNVNQQGLRQNFISSQSSISNGFVRVYIAANSKNLVYQYSDSSVVQSPVVTNYFNGYTGKWVRVAIMADYKAKWIKFYRNGELVQTYTTSGKMVYPSGSVPIYFGALWNGSTTSEYLIGGMDDLRFYTIGPGSIGNGQADKTKYLNDRGDY